ncbi:MAG TPA: DUF763 domain-containing protein, partial [Gemmatimonadaceae bacterium]
MGILSELYGQFWGGFEQERITRLVLPCVTSTISIDFHWTAKRIAHAVSSETTLYPLPATLYPLRHTGIASLPLHTGKAPPWLFSRMTRLSREIVIYLAREFGTAEVLRRLSDPFWFQAFGCVLGFDWHSSGVTTTVCGAVKEGLRGVDRELGLFAAGGKGGTSRKTPMQIAEICDRTGGDGDRLVYASKM